MKTRIILCIFVLLALVSSVTSQKHKRKNKKASAGVADMQKKLQALLRRTPKVPKANERYAEKQQRKVQKNTPVPVFVSPEPVVKDPCDEKRCSAGRECVLDEKGDPQCPCIEECPEFDDQRRMVCSNFNDTWSSDCKLHQMRCICSEEGEDCPDSKLAHMHIDYFGKCQELEECKENEMADFPRRMREWMFNIMQDMVDEGRLPESFRADYAKDDADEWVNAAVMKWCLLDGHPKDSHVSRHELFPLRAPLHAMEHCISPFLDQCDADDNHQITLSEWITCLELKKDHVNEIEDLCDQIRPPKV